MAAFREPSPRGRSAFRRFRLEPVPFAAAAARIRPRAVLAGGIWVAEPAIDLVERDNAFEMTAELPGLEEKNIEVNVANSVLTIKGQKEEEKVEKKEDFHLRERRFGSFARSVRVPETVDMDKIEASFKNGCREPSWLENIELRAKKAIKCENT